ncbi:MAG TPA: BTAD domain-containing putative transcriptional regulator [Gemmatimonadaceae bacterium]
MNPLRYHPGSDIPPGAPMIRITLLGNVSVQVEGVPVGGEAAQRRRLALLAILAAPPVRPHTRDRLIGQLWPEQGTESARHLLSASIHVLRKALGPDVLVTSGDEIGLRADAAEVDAAEFREAYAAAEYERAVDLYRGAFLEGFYISDTPEFEQWVDEERQEYAALYGRALESLAELRAAAGDADGAVAAWRRLAALDPYSARTAIGLMQALVRLGNRPAAIQHARVHAQLLAQEFETAADPEVTALAESLRAQTGAEPSSGVAPRPPLRAAAPPEPPASADASIIPTVSASPSVPAPPEISAAHVSAAPPEPASTEMSAPEATASAARPSPPGITGKQSVAIASRRGFRWTLPAGLAGAALLVIVAFLLRERTQPVTVALLPIASDTINEHWADIAEHIIDRLAQTDRIHVVPSSSTLPLLGQGMEARAIGRHLGARYVVSVATALLRGADSLRVRVELVDVEANDIAWSAAYRFPLVGVFRVQDEIARAVASALEVDAGGSPALRSTEDVGAYEHYLRGTTALAQRTRESLLSAREHFLRAVERDSTYALAYARLAETYGMLGSYDYGVMEPRYAYEQARTAVARASVLEPELDAAYAMSGNIHANYDWDVGAAERELRHALQLNSRCSSCRQWLGLLYATQERHADAAAQLDTAVSIDPASPIAYVNAANVHYYAKQYDAAAAAADRALQVDETFGRAHLMRALIDFQRGRRSEALQRVEMLQQTAGEPALLAVLTYQYGMTGDTARALAYFRNLEAVAAERYVPAEYRALSYLGIGDKDGAFAQLDEAMARRSNGMIYLSVEPMLSPLHADPRYATLVRALRAGG